MKRHIYRLLAAQRRRLGLSQAELAARAGLRREKISRLESKGESIGFDELCRLLDAVGLESAVRKKGKQASGLPSSASFSNAVRSLPCREFRKASFIDGAKAKILSWGKLPK